MIKTMRAHLFHQRERRINLFFKMLLSFALIDTIFLVCILSLYHINLNTAGNIIDHNIENAISFGQTYLEETVLSCENQAVQLTSAMDVLHLYNQPSYSAPLYTNAYRVLKTYRSLLTSMQDQGVSNILFSLDNGIVFCNSLFYPDINTLYGSHFYYEGTTLDEWTELVKTKRQFWPAHSIEMLHMPVARYLVYNCINPINPHSTHVIFMFSEEELLKRLLPGISLEHIGLSLYNAKEGLLFERPLDMGTERKKLDFYSKQLNMRFVVSVGNELYIRSISSMLNPIRYIIIISLALEALLLIMLLLWNTRPLRDLASTMERYIGCDTALYRSHPIDSAIQLIPSLYSTQNQLKDELNDLEATLRNTELKYLISSFPSGEKYTPKLLKLNSPMRILLFCIPQNEPLDQRLTRLIDEIYSAPIGSCLIQGRFLLLISEQSELVGRESLERALRNLQDVTGYQFHCAVSNPFSNPEHARRAYLEADYTLLRGDYQGKFISFFDNQMPKENLAPLSLHYYRALDAALSAGALQSTDRFFDALARDTVSPLLSATQYQQILQILSLYLSTYLNCPNEGAITIQSIDVTDKKGFDTSLASLREQALHIAAINAHDLDDSKSGLSTSLLAYIDAHYNNPDMSLTLLANQFGVTPKYISDLIRQRHGKAYMDYLQDLRMSAALTLIEHFELPLQEIAIQVGYQSANTFYKGFRRYYGMSPSDYRTMHFSTHKYRDDKLQDE